MKQIILAAMFSMMLIVPTAFAQEGMGQVVLQNNSSSTADLFLSGVYGCRASGNGGFCPVQVRAGTYDLEARLFDKRSVSVLGIIIYQGEVRTFTIQDIQR